ncbi:hypothetical protein CHU92_08290 [Flavobacterium cyanobacteriorum]|uniref:DUF2797 domain-containing protein n=1 Tax=Flavobacterium cyanobacteriorum TaxID=2022802 RepID=A0A255Z7E1_9FLAO|nr:DUF2797 domain-containing protein [Flavobacterium cyanobacteriorum]OYQ37467.1 hypothetical protein CHU92_08290 [Flavobacterium cyanobacteriorum]
MQYEGVLTKMQAEAGSPIQYYLVFEDSFLHMNQLLGKPFEITFMGYQCLHCSKKKKIYRMGYCYDCFYVIPGAGDWIMRPELSTAHLDVADRDLEYEKKAQLQPHIVYLASASDMKVGVTRKTQVPTRWIDQGASQAIALVEVPNRYLAGITEVALKSHFSDKINWKKMLLNEIAPIDLTERRRFVQPLLPDEVQQYFETTGEKIYNLEYPVLEYPKKISSLNLVTTPVFEGKLTGIKGQYLMFEDGTVFNVRAFEGFGVRINV